MTADACLTTISGEDNKSGYYQDDTKHYYKRGSGPVPLEGPEDYSKFSKAVTGNELLFAEAPEEVMNLGEPIGKMDG